MTVYYWLLQLYSSMWWKITNMEKDSPTLYPPSLSLDPQLLPHVCGASSDQILQLGPLRLSRTFYNTAFGQRHNLRSSSSSSDERQFSPRKGKGKTSRIHSILLCRQQWRGRSCFVQSGTVRFGFCSWWSFVSLAPLKLRSPAGHASLGISGVHRNYCWNSTRVNPHRD